MEEDPKGNVQETSEQAPKRYTKAKRIGFAALALFLTAIVFVAGWIGGYYIVDARARNLAWMLEAVEDHYYGETSREALYDAAYDALELDKFCTHYTPEEYEQLKRESEGYGEGYGISLYSEGNAVRLYRVIGNSPADRAGLSRGMYVYSVGDGESTTSGPRDEMVSFLRERESAVLSCGFEADGSDAKEYTLTRSSSYAAAYCYYMDSEATYKFRDGKLENVGEGLSSLGGYAYIALIAFEGNAADEMQSALTLMKERGRKDLVLDLRGNGGGYLSILCDISSHLLRSAEGSSPPIATATYRDGKKEEYKASGNDFSSYFEKDAKIRVFADENSASASEALLGAMLDYGTISYSDIYLRKETGRTYGKGVMQSTFVTPDGNALRLTVAGISWPKGNSIHERGITLEDGAVAVEAPVLPYAHDVFFDALAG